MNFVVLILIEVSQILYGRNIYEPSNNTRVTAASGLVEAFRIALPAIVKIKNGTSSAYSRL